MAMNNRPQRILVSSSLTSAVLPAEFGGQAAQAAVGRGNVMAKKPITEFDPMSVEWIGDTLSYKPVVYGSGRIARAGDPVRHNVDPDELARCRSLAAEAQSLRPPDLPSEGDFEWYQFFIAANLDDPAPERIDEAVVRERFGGTILPIIQILISPIREGSLWWDKNMYDIRSGSDLRADRAGVSLDVWMQRSLAGARALDEKGLDRYETDKAQQKVGDPLLTKIFEIPKGRRLEWSDVTTTLDIRRLQRLIRFFARPEFRDAAYVEIGDYHHPERVPEEQWPEGMEAWPTCLPRLIFGLTLGGSLAGLASYIVET
jgi:hypothetical protein